MDNFWKGFTKRASESKNDDPVKELFKAGPLKTQETRTMVPPREASRDRSGSAWLNDRDEILPSGKGYYDDPN